MSDWSADSEQFFELEDLEQNGKSGTSENEQNLQMFELEECDKLMPEHRWVPGHSMGTSVGQLGQGVGNLSAQSQMLLVNVFYSLKRLPVEMVKNLCVGLLPFQEGVKVKPWAAQAASLPGCGKQHSGSGSQTQKKSLGSARAQTTAAEDSNS